MAHTILQSHTVKVGRYSKEFIKLTFTASTTTPVVLDTRMNTVLYGVLHVNTDMADTDHHITVIPSNSGTTATQVLLAPRTGAVVLNGQTVVVELTGY